MAENTGGSAPASSAPSSTPAPTSTPSSSTSAPGKGLEAGLAAATKAPSNPTPNPTPGAQPEGGAAPTQEQRDAATKEAIRRFKVKVAGKEREVDEQELVRGYSLGEGANSKFEEAARMRNEAMDFIRTLKQNPEAILTSKALGIDFRKVAQDYLAREIEREMMSPEQRLIQEQKAELQRYEEEKRQQREAQEQQQRAEAIQRFRGEYEKTITEALQKGGLPKSPRTVKRMAELIAANQKLGLDLTPQDMIDQLRSDYQAECQELFGQTDGETLLAILGEGIANKIRKADLARIRGGGAVPPTPPPSSQVPDAPKVGAEGAPKEREVLGVDEFRERLRKKLG